MAAIELAALATRTESGTGDTEDTSNVALLRLTLTCDSGDTFANRGRATLPKRFACQIQTRETGGAWRVLHTFKEADRTTGAISAYGLTGFPCGSFRCVVQPDDETRAIWTIERGEVPGHVSASDVYASVAFSVAGTAVEGA